MPGVTRENVRIYVEGDAPWTGNRTIGHYGGALDKRNCVREPEPHAWSIYREIQAAKGSAFSKDRSGILHAETLALSRILAAQRRSNEKLFLNNFPGSSDERLGYWAKVLDVSVVDSDTLQDIRRECAVRWRTYNGRNTVVVEQVLRELLPDEFVGLVRKTGSSLSSAPANTRWPALINASEAWNLHSTVGEGYLSERAHVNVLVASTPGREGGEELAEQRLIVKMNTKVFPVLDSLFGSEVTFSYSILSPREVEAFKFGALGPFPILLTGDGGDATQSEYGFHKLDGFLEYVFTNYREAITSAWIAKSRDITEIGSGVDEWQEAPGWATTFDQNTDADRPNWIAGGGSTVLNGAPHVSFDKANTEWLAHSQAAGAWNYLHNGNGGTVVLVLEQGTFAAAFEVIFSTQTALDATTIGVTLAYSAANTLHHRISNGGVGTYLIANEATVPSGPIVITIRYGATSCSFRVNGVEYAALGGPYNGSPSASDASSTLHLGSRGGGGGSYGEFNLGFLGTSAFELTDQEIVQIEQACAAEFGIEL